MILNKLKAIFNSKPNSELTKTIEQLDMTVRTYNVLSRAGVATVGDLTKLSWDNLASIRGSNRRSIEEVVGLLKGIGLKLREEER